MTEMHVEDRRRRKPGVNRIKKANLKIDMTPMVDLGFLLVSFFVFTTELSKPVLTNLYMPKDGDPTPIPESKSLTILLSSNNTVFYYRGDISKAMKNNEVFQSSYDETNGIGSIIRKKQNELIKNRIDKKDLVVLIKPGVDCSYKNVISALDEMLINGVTRYAIVDQGADEKSYVAYLNDHH